MRRILLGLLGTSPWFSPPRPRPAPTPAPKPAEALFSGMGAHRHPIGRRAPRRRSTSIRASPRLRLQPRRGLPRVREAARSIRVRRCRTGASPRARSEQQHPASTPSARSRRARPCSTRARSRGRRRRPSAPTSTRSRAATRGCGRADRKALGRRDYAKAMRELARRYPDDLDAATLYAESLMDLHPWKLWTPTAQPARDTVRSCACSSRCCGATRAPRREPLLHPRGRGVAQSGARAAERRRASRRSRRRAGHLVHMPAHVYMRTGDYAASAEANSARVAADRDVHLGDRARGCTGLMYCRPQLPLPESRAATMAGRGAAATRAAEDLVGRAAARDARLSARTSAWSSASVATPLFVALRFRRVGPRARRSPSPRTRSAWVRALRHYAPRRRARGADDRAPPARSATPSSRARRRPRRRRRSATTPPTPSSPSPPNVLDARIVAAASDAAIALAQAVAAEDALTYNEPPDWYYPVRESLGAALLRAGRPAEAEAVFRDDLVRNPRNPRSLSRARGRPSGRRSSKADAALEEARVRGGLEGRGHEGEAGRPVVVALL